MRSAPRRVRMAIGLEELSSSPKGVRFCFASPTIAVSIQGMCAEPAATFWPSDLKKRETWIGQFVGSSATPISSAMTADAASVRPLRRAWVDSPSKLCPEICPRLHRAQPNSLDLIRSIRPDSAP
jgi:hypothetical protein